MRTFLSGLMLIAVLSFSGSVFAAGPQDTWQITAPANGATVTGTEVTITIDPGEIKVVKPGPVAAGEGHWHFFVDGAEVGKGPVNTFTYTNLSPGQHTLKVELHQGDHSIYPDDMGREIMVNVALPNTGTNTATMAGAGVALLLAGGYLLRRRSAAAAR